MHQPIENLGHDAHPLPSYVASILFELVRQRNLKMKWNLVRQIGRLFGWLFSVAGT